MKPRELGYRWPAEWEPHVATWLAWPHNLETWPGKFAPVPPVFAEFVRTLARFETVNVLAGGAAVMQQARQYVDQLPNVQLWDIPTNDCWIRDHGPTFLSAGAQPPALLDWQYNAWGGKYPPYDQDNAVPARIAEQTGRRRFALNVVLEGGSIEGNGRGSMLVNDACVLNTNRNASLTPAAAEAVFRDNLSIDHVIWLHNIDLVGDDTDGHIDQLARFANPHTVLYAACEDATDPNFASLARLRAQLNDAVDQNGAPLQLRPLPIPSPLFQDGQRLPASYCNYYVANGVVIVPLFDDPHDATAMATLADCFPDREIVGIRAIDLVWGLGAFHCATQQEPA